MGEANFYYFTCLKFSDFLKGGLKIKRQNGSRHQSQIHEKGPQDGAQEQGYLLAPFGQALQVLGPKNRGQVQQGRPEAFVYEPREQASNVRRPRLSHDEEAWPRW